MSVLHLEIPIPSGKRNRYILFVPHFLNLKSTQNGNTLRTTSRFIEVVLASKLFL